MFLKSLEMVGFKSFAEAKIEFPRGVTAVVGPNGSGKSNVVDAILWVLGEQSTKTLRSERMEDVIFNGTEVRKPMGMAEVTLVIAGIQPGDLQGMGDASSLLSDYSEVMVTRRLFRNGDSEYLLNKTLCRLKDVRSVMLDTRAGTKGHTVIAQGQLDQILNASPQGRRELIEETAGIVRYKKQKAEALRKLEATQQNLVRVRDVIGEVKKQLNWLERQAQQARTYDSLQTEGRTIEVRLLSDDYCRLVASREAVDLEGQELACREAESSAEQGRLDAQAEELKLAMQRDHELLQEVQQELAAVETQRAQALGQVQVERNRAELLEHQQAQAVADSVHCEEDRARAEHDLEALAEQFGVLETELEGRIAQADELDRQHRGLRGRQEDLDGEQRQANQNLLLASSLVVTGESAFSRLESRLQENRERIARLVREADELSRRRQQLHDQLSLLIKDREVTGERHAAIRSEQEATGRELTQTGEQLTAADQRRARDLEQLAATESRLRTLQAVVREEMGYGREGEEATTSVRTCEGIRDAIAECLVVVNGYDRAIEALLGERVRAWFVDSPRHASEAIAFLKQKDLGRGAFLPLSFRSENRAESVDSPGWWPALSGQPGVLGRASDVVQVQGDFQPALASLFARALIVSDVDQAVRLWEQGDWTSTTGPTLVTLAGEVLEPYGVITGGSAQVSGGVLQRRREVQQLEEHRGTLLAGIETLRTTREHLHQHLEQLRDRAQALQRDLREIELKAVALSKDHSGSEQSLVELTGRMDRIGEERRELESDAQSLAEQIAAKQQECRQAVMQRDEAAGLVTELQQRQEQWQQEMEGIQERATEARLAVGTLRARREHLAADRERLQRQLETCRVRLEQLAQAREELMASLQISLSERDRQQEVCQELGRQTDQIQARSMAAQGALAQRTELLRDVERTLAELRGRLESVRQRRLEVEVKRAQVQMQLEVVQGTLTGTYQVELPRTDSRDQAADGAPADIEAQMVSEEERQVLRDRLQKIRDRLAKIGGVNLAAIEEHRQLEERYQFLTSQEEDLTKSIKSLKEIIQRINRTTKELFQDTFAQLQQKFGELFQKVFPGGRAELVSVEPEPEAEGESDGPAEPGIDIVAQPPGKRLKSITMLSGGEKTLTAMALLFASFLIRPTPFCILDEIDAPLDEENIGRFTRVLCELAASAQFIVITHNKRTMSIADSLFGVTMEEPGVSKLVSVRLTDLQLA
ncbi:MAG: chromosome segregation protein SMC [Nitrospiraceae bacterium]